MSRRRRLSLRQAIACETGRPMKYPAKQRAATRCRCGGKSRGLARCHATNPTRWCFCELPADDPHFIPRQRRRISPRRAVQALTHAQRRLEARGNFPAAELIRRARHIVDQQVRDDRQAARRAKLAHFPQLEAGYDPLVTLQHAIEQLGKWGADVETQMLLASIKMDLRYT